MTLSDIQQIKVLQTRAIAAACTDEKTLFYVIDCLNRFYSGDYGEICAQDVECNNQDLAAGAGHILARYKPMYELASSIYIECHFDEAIQGIDYNNTMIMYCNER